MLSKNEYEEMIQDAAESWYEWQCSADAGEEEMSSRKWYERKLEALIRESGRPYKEVHREVVRLGMSYYL